ncbi:YceI family protein [Corynebacterium lubricantis]|uniref:YceI family protein n=1 Tax=Corynebacterium lubricantis TaxID=541095 RepID=UPI001FE0BC65|nr:YceI family protein [Corynebacterium lubricantis]
MILAVVVLVILALAAFALFPVIYTLVMGAGVKTEGINEQRTQPATTEVDGEWQVNTAPGPNSSSAGFTFYEVLPAERKVTSGSTEGVTGAVTIAEGQVKAGEITVDMTNIVTDRDVRDVNVRQKILHTDEFPESNFVLTEPADVSNLPDDGSIGNVELTGDLTIHGETRQITHTFDVVRSGNNLIVAGDIPINRQDYGVESPEFVAATIADEGEVNLRINLSQASN